MKKVILLFTIFMLTLALLAACNKTRPEQPNTPATQAATETTPAQTGGEQSQDDIAPFINIAWTRDAENDTETIYFGEDGSFRYSCGCGNPVNDSDLCEGYSYDAQTKTISLEYIETTEEAVTQITVKSCDGKTLVLDFAGDLRTFQLEEETIA